MYIVSSWLIQIAGDMNGRSALPDLVKQCVDEGEWKNLDREEQEWLLAQLRESKADKAVTKSVTRPALDIEATLSRLNPEVSILYMPGSKCGPDILTDN
jgi:hypothetical protein